MHVPVAEVLERLLKDSWHHYVTNVTHNPNGAFVCASMLYRECQEGAVIVKAAS